MSRSRRWTRRRGQSRRSRHTGLRQSGTTARLFRRECPVSVLQTGTVSPRQPGEMYCPLRAKCSMKGCCNDCEHGKTWPTSSLSPMRSGDCRLKTDGSRDQSHVTLSSSFGQFRRRRSACSGLQRTIAVRSRRLSPWHAGLRDHFCAMVVSARTQCGPTRSSFKPREAAMFAAASLPSSGMGSEPV